MVSGGGFEINQFFLQNLQNKWLTQSRNFADMRVSLIEYAK